MKCFLSHSSLDKQSYVSIVASRLPTNVIVYDELTFESGMPNLSEITRGLDITDVFVLFLSDEALKSPWVKREITAAKEHFDAGIIEKIFPLIIDANLKHDDPRIPEWMRTEYNLRLVSRPVSAARRIEQRLRELSWSRHPKIKEKEKIFVGRNSLVREIEERLDDTSKDTPTCIIGSGLKRIGRRTLLKSALHKTNIIGSFYEPLRLHLSREDSIEGFIVKVYDFGLSSEQDVGGLLTKSIPEKIAIASGLCRNIYDARDLIVVEDDGCLVGPDGTITEWFSDVVSHIPADRTLFALASTYRLNRSSVWKNERVFSVEVPELSPTERAGLLKRYCDLDEISLAQDDFRWLAELFQGYPDQVFFAVDMIHSNGIDYTKSHSHDITEFNKNRAGIVLRHYEENLPAIELLRLLSGFEFISYRLIAEIANGEAAVEQVRQFVHESICDELGAAREYVRVNDVIRDYVLRNRLQIPSGYAEKIRKYAAEYIERAGTDGDVSEYYFFLRQALVDGRSVDEHLLIPAHFLSTLQELYSARRYSDVTALSDRILLKAQFLDRRVEQDVRYYLCQSLARLKQERFLSEVQKIQGPEHDFLLGFYYRRQGRYKDAEERLKKATASKRAEHRARRELVTTYLLMDEWEKAFSLAKENYAQYPTNPYLIQAYFNCLIQIPHSEQTKGELLELIAGLEAIKSEKSQEMLASAKALYSAVYSHDEAEALIYIDDAIATYPGNDYPVLTKMDICVRFGDAIELGKCIEHLRNRVDRTSAMFNAYKKSQAIYLALTGNPEKALRIVERELRDYSDAGKIRLVEKISEITRSKAN